MAQLLKPSQVKKGDKIVKVSIWNFHGQNEPRRDQHRRDEKGRSVYTPHTVDQYNVCEYTVYSCGKKQMYLCDEEGLRGKVSGVDYRSTTNPDRFYGMFVKTNAEALELIEELHKADQYATPSFEIVNVRF